MYAYRPTVNSLGNLIAKVISRFRKLNGCLYSLRIRTHKTFHLPHELKTTYS